jgi:hypothetical protein
MAFPAFCSVKDELAGRALAKVLSWDAREVSSRGAELQVMANLKYDEYEGFRPGEGFLEHLTAWLSQMEKADRARAVEFVRRELVFISRAELDHLIETVYPDIIRPLLVRKTAGRLGVPSWKVSEITASSEFSDLHRKTLLLALGDGARIDRLRRTSQLSHEQFYLSPELSDSSADRMAETLRKAVGDDGALFEQVLLVDDFAGSGATALRHKDGEWEGRLERIRIHLQDIAGKAVVQDPTVWVLLYVSSAQARAHIENMLHQRGLGWDLHVVQELDDQLAVDDAEMLDMCRRYFDDANYEILGHHVMTAPGDVRVGFGDGMLPVVLSHNTPNNSISLLWADTTDRPGSDKQRALFPRRHRHNAERP